MDGKIDNLKEEVDFTDNNDKLDKLKKSYLILKQKVCRSHDLIKLYNDKLKECERMKIDLDLANKETKKMTSNYNLTLAKVIKLELQNAEYKKDIESLSNTIAAHETKMAGDRQHLQQLTCKMKELEENHMDKIMQLDLDKSLLQENIKELKCQLKISNKNCDSSKRKTNKRQQNIEDDANIHSDRTISTVDVAVNTVSDAISTMDVAVNTIGSDIKLNTLIEKSVMTDISCNIDKNDLYPLFCNECEIILSNPYDKICRSMTKHPRLIESISSPIKSLHTKSTSTTERDENLANYHDNNEICNFGQSSEGINAHKNSSNSPTVSLKPELSLQDHHLIRSKPFADLATNPIPFSNQFNGLPNTVQTPCLISESNNLSNLTTSSNSVHIIEKLEEKMKRLEKRIKKQSRKRKQLSTNHLQYFPHMNCYPNDILSQNLSLNMASTFWNEVKNLMNDKRNKCVENQKKRHESKLCKFSSKKIKLKHRLRQNNILSHNNAWNIDSIIPCATQPMAVDNSTATDHLEHSSVDVLSNLANNDTALHNFSGEINLDKDKCCDALIEGNAKNTILFSTPKKTYVTNMHDDESLELSLCEDIKDNMSHSMEDTNSSDSNDTQCYTPTVKITAQQLSNIPFTAETFDTRNKNYFKNKITDTTTSTTTTSTTTTTTTSITTTSTTNTIATNDTIAINDIVATTSKASIISTSATINDTCNESGTDKQTRIPYINEFLNTEFTVEEMSQIVNNVPPNAKMSNSIDESKVNNCTIAANSITVAKTCPKTNFTTTTCRTSRIISTTNNVSTNCSNKSTTTISTGIITRAQKRKLQCNSQMDLLTVKRNNERTKDTSENAMDNKSGTFENCITQKKQRISHEVNISNNQEVLREHSNVNQAVDDVTVPLTCKATDSIITRTNLNKNNNHNDTSKVNDLISKDGKSTEATIINSSGFISDVDENECMQEQSINESVKAGHSNTRTKNVDLHMKSKFPTTKAAHVRIMEHLKNLRSRPPCKVNDFELFHSNEPIIPDNQDNNQDKCAPQAVHNKNNEMKNNENKCILQNVSNKNSEIKNNENNGSSEILHNKISEIKHNEDKCVPQNVDNKNSEIKNNENNCTSQILHNKISEIKHNEDKCVPQNVDNKNSEIKNNENNCTSQILHNKISEIKHNKDKCVPQNIGNKNSEMKDNEDKCTSQILCNKNSEIKYNEDKCVPQNVSNKNSEIKNNENKCTPQILYNKNSEIRHNIIKSYSNMNIQEEYKLPFESVDLSIQRTDETSQQDESDIGSDKYGKNPEKNCNAVNAKNQSGLQRIIDETQKFSWINSISKNKRIDFEAPTNITDTTICDENNVDDQPHHMEIITSENTENIDNNASMSLEVVSPITLLKNHFNTTITPKGLRTSKKALKEMAEICKATDNFVKRQLLRVLNNCDWGMSVHTDVVNKLSSTCTVRIVASGIVEFMLERAMHNLDKTYTPPAPLMTIAQQRITALLVDLETRMPTVIKVVQAGIEYKIFRLNKTPMYHQIQNLIRLYVVLARIQKDREKVRMLCCDALYCLGLHAIPVVYTALTSWPEIFPQFTENTDMLPKCMAHIVVSIQAVDFPQLNPLKHLISTYYRFKAGNYLTTNLMEELLNSLEGNHSSTGVDGLKTAIILLAKKEGTFWTYTNVIQANLLPRIVNRKYSSMFEAFCLLGHLLRTFPVEDSNSTVKNIIEQLSDLIESGEGSEDQQEGIISALLSLSRHNFEKVAESVMKWTPTKPLRASTIDQYSALFSFRSSMHWKGFMKKTLNKM